jgi:hypothetical protein
MNRLTEYSNQNGYLLVKIAAPWTVQTAKQAIDEIKVEVAKRNYDHLLLDLNQWDKPDTELTRFLSGEYLAKVFRPPFKVAAYSISGVINKFGEDVAVNRGAIYRIFQDEQLAIQWLLE